MIPTEPEFGEYCHTLAQFASEMRQRGRWQDAEKLDNAHTKLIAAVRELQGENDKLQRWVREWDAQALLDTQKLDFLLPHLFKRGMSIYDVDIVDRETVDAAMSREDVNT
jgi:hypothetical protein